MIYHTITGGSVTAVGGYHGIYAGGGSITINGGTVTASGSNGGINPEWGTVTIDQGLIVAAGESSTNASVVSGQLGSQKWVYIEQAPEALTGNYLDENKAEKPLSGITQLIRVRSYAANWGVADQTTWYVVDKDVEIANRVTVNGDVRLILMDGATLTAKQGVTVAAGNSLTIYGQSAGTGKLIAGASSDENAVAVGIGGAGGAIGKAGTITINGGTVKATGAHYGIDGTITINAGSVEATAVDNLSAYGIFGSVTITGGRVKATAAGNYGYGIYGSVKITGGDVTAIGSVGGIIAMENSSIVITGGDVTASGGVYGIVLDGEVSTLTIDDALTIMMGVSADDENQAEVTDRSNLASSLTDKWVHVSLVYQALNNTAPEITLTKAENNKDAAEAENPQVGDTLTAVTTPVKAAPVTYEWYRDGVKIDGATGKTYVLTADDVGKTITVKALQAANADGNSSAAVETPVSTATAAVKKQDNTAAQITEDDLRNAVTKTDTGIIIAPVSGYEYAVVAKGAAIEAGTVWHEGGESLTFDNLPPGTEYDVYVRAKGGNDTKPGTPTKITVKTNVTVTIGEPVVEGIAITVTIAPDVEDATYQWYRGEEAISGATGKDYAPTSDDINKTLTLKVSKGGEVIGSAVYGDDEGEAVKNFNAYLTDLATPATVTLAGGVTDDVTIPENKEITLDLNDQTINGRLTVNPGANLTINATSGGVINNNVSNSGTMTINGGTFEKAVTGMVGTVTIKGGKFDETPTASGTGTVVFEGGYYDSSEISSAPVTAPYKVQTQSGWANAKNNPDASDAEKAEWVDLKYTYRVVCVYIPLTEKNKPTVSGGSDTPQVGDTLTASTTATDLSYQWYRGDELIEGATDATYTATAEDVGKTIKVTVTQTKKQDGTTYGEGETKPAQTSAAIGPIKKNLGNDDVEVTFTGGGSCPTVTVRYGDPAQTVSTNDYTVEYSDPTGTPSIVTVTVTPKDGTNYTGTITKKYTLAPEASTGFVFVDYSTEKFSSSRTDKNGVTYEISEKSDFSDPVSGGANLLESNESSKTYYIRVAEKTDGDAYPASGATQFTITRPNKPATGIFAVTDTSSSGTNDGGIRLTDTSLAARLEYKLSSAESYTGFTERDLHGAIADYDDTATRQLITNIKALDQEHLLIRFKDGTEIEQIIQKTRERRKHEILRHVGRPRILHAPSGSSRKRGID